MKNNINNNKTNNKNNNINSTKTSKLINIRVQNIIITSHLRKFCISIYFKYIIFNAIRAYNLIFTVIMKARITLKINSLLIILPKFRAF